MPQIEHIEVAGGNNPPLSGWFDNLRIYAVTLPPREGPHYHYVIKFNFDDLIRLSFSADSKTDVEFDLLLDENGDTTKSYRPSGYIDENNVSHCYDRVQFFGATLRPPRRELVSQGKK